MFASLGQFVARRWPWVIAAWVAIVVIVRLVAPAWTHITARLATWPSCQLHAQRKESDWPRPRFRQLEPGVNWCIVAARVIANWIRRIYVRPIDLTARFHNRLGANELDRGRRILANPAESAQASEAFAGRSAGFRRSHQT